MTLSDVELTSLVQAVGRKTPTAQVVGVRVRDSLPQRTVLQVDGTTWNVEPVRTSFEARRCIARRAPSQRLLLVTALEPSELGSDVLAQLANYRLETIEPWTAVRDAYRVNEIDPRVFRIPGMARMLLDAARQGAKPIGSGTLDLDSAWAALVSLLGLPVGAPSLDDFFEAAHTGQLGGRWVRAPVELRSAFKIRLDELLRRDQAEGLGAVVLHALDRGAGDRLVSLGLVANALAAPALHAEQRGLARGRLVDHGLHVQDVSPERELSLLRRFGDRASAWLRTRVDSAGFASVQSTLFEASTLLATVDSGVIAALSPDLSSGLDARLEKVASSLEVVVRGVADGSATEALAGVEDAWAAVEAHVLRAVDPRFIGSVQAAEAAVRLSRWLVMSGSDHRSIAEMGIEYRDGGAWVDRARAMISRPEGHSALASVFLRLSEVVAARRERANLMFAQTYQRTSRGEVGDGGVLWLERVLEEVAGPLVSAGAPVLVIVMDGMSQAIATEIFSSIAERSPLRRVAPNGVWPPVIAPLPTTTETCRTSFFGGKLCSGNQASEATGFVELANRLRWSTDAAPARLFRKGELATTANQVPKFVTDAVESECRIVATVINAIDDLLSRADQLRPEWSRLQIPLLEALLATAEAVGRAVVVVADHGHVVEWKQTRGDGSVAESSRWRRPGGALREEEIEVVGTRVVQPVAGGPIVVPWSEQIRYGQQQAGYHGGVSLQEAVVPLAVFAPVSIAEKLNWLPEAADPPSWWTGAPPSPVASPPRIASPPTVPGRTAPQPVLFDVAPVAGPARVDEAAAQPLWLAELLASESYRAQRRLAGRRPASDADVQAVLQPIVDAGGALTIDGLARAAGLPEGILRPKLAAVARLMNVEGYPILEESTGGVRLNVELLRVQFGLPSHLEFVRSARA